jgi:hypothetical protein
MGEQDEEIANLKARLAEVEAAKATTPKKPDPKQAAAGCLVIVVVLVVVSVILGMCSEKDSKPSPVPVPSKGATADPVPATPEAPPPPSHNWQYREGLEYGYQGAISQDAQNSGVAASQVHMFRYLGEKGGIYTIQGVESGLRASCANPCEVMKLTGGGITQRVAFSSGSIAGAAMEDAINGQMSVWHPNAKANPEEN